MRDGAAAELVLKGERVYVGLGGLGVLEDVDVLERALLPAEVHAHAAHDDLGPGVLVVLEGVDGVVEPELEPRRVRAVKLPARADALLAGVEGVVLDHRVLEPARCMHNGHRAVALGVHLRQAARLVPIQAGAHGCVSVCVCVCVCACVCVRVCVCACV